MNFKNIRINQITDAFYLYSKKGKKDKTINRKYYGLSFCDCGKITYIQNGIKTISTPNSIVLLPKGGTYDIIRQQSGYFPVINFESDKIISNQILSFSFNDNKRVINLFFELKDSFFNGKQYESISIFYKILSIIFESTLNKNKLKLNNYLQEHLSDPYLDNKQIAEFLKISVSYLNKLFYNEYSISPKKYIIGKRIELAKQLLSENQYTIGEICEKCGYTNVYSFSRAFKDYTKISPSAYKQKFKNRYI